VQLFIKKKDTIQANIKYLFNFFIFVVCRLNDCIISGMDGVGAESISALVSFLADMDDGRIWMMGGYG
jgi:hypothetical protein